MDNNISSDVVLVFSIKLNSDYLVRVNGDIIIYRSQDIKRVKRHCSEIGCSTVMGHC